MNTKQTIAYGLIAVVIALAFIALSMTGCKQPTDPPTVTLTGITANYTGGSVGINTDVNSLKGSLAVTANYSDNTSKTLKFADYSLSGDLSASGQKTVTVTYEGKTTTFTVTVTTAITYTATQYECANKTADSTGIVFTFSASVDSLNLTAYDITVGGTAVKGTTMLRGTGTTRTLAITVNSAGTATVSINKIGIEAETKHVTVYKAGQTILPNEAIPLTENQWADGNISTPGDEQWFTFTAAESTQYIHIDYGTLTVLDVQVYDSSGATVGSEERFYSATTNTSRLLTTGQTYYIRVRQTSSDGSGTYQIGFTTSTTAPPIQLPANAIPLTKNQWADGNIPTPRDEQWFTFTATASAQFIHADLSTSTSLYGGIYVQVYDSGGVTVDSQASLSSFTSASRSLTTGQTYYIKVTSYLRSYSGTYRIAFNETVYSPGTNLIPLTENQWADGNMPASNDQHWFTFTATASTQFIHADFGTLNFLTVNVYDSSGAVGSETDLYNSIMFTNTSRSLTVGQTYYIRVTTYNINFSGTYRIAFTMSIIPPGAIELTENIWANGNIPTSNSQQWFTFAATASTPFIHIEIGTLTQLYVQVYDSGGTTLEYENLLSTSTSISLTTEQTHYIRVMPDGSSQSSDYRIAFNASIIPPDINPIQLIETIWSDGNITTPGDVQWFTFIAVESAQYIHFSTTGTLKDVYVQVYNSSSSAEGSETRMYGSTTRISRTLIQGQRYYIKVRPNGTNSGSYRIGFTTSTTPPIQLPSNAIPLTVNQWADGSLPSTLSEQWFVFTATASSQYIHIETDTVQLDLQVCNSSGGAVGSETTLSNATSVSRWLTTGQTYYIRVRNGIGTYQITFNTSFVPPPGVIGLTVNQWADGSLPTAGSHQQWFVFTATASIIPYVTQYIHADLSTLSASNSMWVQVYRSNGSAVESETRMYGTTTDFIRIDDLTPGQMYYIRVRLSDNTGTYRIGFTTSSTPPTS